MESTPSKERQQPERANNSTSHNTTANEEEKKAADGNRGEEQQSLFFRRRFDEQQQQQPFQYLVILDFEATCWTVTSTMSKSQVKKKQRQQEIIEFPSVLIETSSGRVVSEFQQYVQPQLQPKLSEFCTNLTGITQEIVDTHGVLFHEALVAHKKWLESQGLLFDDDDKRRFLVVTCGDWDLKTMLPKQLRHLENQNSISNTSVPPMHFQSWANIKQLFDQHYPGKKTFSMIDMLESLGMELQGRHHSGIDDCRNIARIAIQLTADGCRFVPTMAATATATAANTTIQTHSDEAE